MGWKKSWPNCHRCVVDDVAVAAAAAAAVAVTETTTGRLMLASRSYGRPVSLIVRAMDCRVESARE
jgi:hypothetical protein